MSETVEKLIDYWRGQGLSLRQGCYAKIVADFERRNDAELPPAMRDYYLSVDGMKETFQNSEDRNGFSFWPLDRVTRVREAIDGAFIRPFKGDVNFFVFADYMQWSWAYAANFAPGSSCSIILVGRDSPELVATSFEEFVELYTSDSARLYKGTDFSG